MQHKYFSFFLITVFLILFTALSSCSDNENDISGPSITIIQPVANDTLHSTGHSVTVEVKSAGKVNIDEMEMTVKSQSGTVLFTYEQYSIGKQSYTCIESFVPHDITEVTKVTLNVKSTNELKAWNKKSINFYLMP